MDKETPLEEGGQAIINFNLKMINDSYPLKVRVKSYMKSKEASWWIIVGNEETNEMLALKKLHFKKKAKRSVKVQLPENFSKNKYIKTYLISDSYIGINQVYDLNILKRKKE